MIAAMHLLSASDIPDKLDEQSSDLNKLIIQTRKCLDGEKTAEEASGIARALLQYSVNKWPKYQNLKQEDAAEYLLRILSTDNDLQKEVETTISHTITCSNKECNLKKQDLKNKEQIIIIDDLKNSNEISLQRIIDQTTYKEKSNRCVKCKSLGKETKKITQAPDKLVIQINRTALNGAKIETAIKCSKREIYIWENERKLTYKVEGVIIHKGDRMTIDKGEETQRGHYVYNHYIEDEDKWVQISNDEISLFDMREENQKGVVFILKQKDITNQNQHPTPMVMLRTADNSKQTETFPLLNLTQRRSAVLHRETGEEPNTNRLTTIKRKSYTLEQNHSTAETHMHNADHNSREYNNYYTYHPNITSGYRENSKSTKERSYTHSEPEDVTATIKEASRIDMNTTNNRLNDQLDHDHPHDTEDEICPESDMIMKEIPTIIMFPRARSNVVESSNKRCYYDRDEPIEELRLKCWWHKGEDCIFGENCWFTDHKRNINDRYSQRRPFHGEAQQDWADSTF